MSEQKEAPIELFEERQDAGRRDVEMQKLSERRQSWSEVVVSFAKSPHRSSGAHNLETEEIAEERKASFSYSILGLSSSEAERRLLVYGRNELAEKTIPKWYILISQFWKPMSIMIWIAVIVEAAIQGFADMGILLAILFTNSFIAYYETVKAGNAVAALKQTLHPHTTVLRDGSFRQMEAVYLVPGDQVLLGAGSAVPADCVPNEGEIEVDEAPLTGESLPVTKFKGDSCKMGSNVVRGEVHATVEVTGMNTFVGRTANLLQVRYLINLLFSSRYSLAPSQPLITICHLCAGRNQWKQLPGTAAPDCNNFVRHGSSAVCDCLHLSGTANLRRRGTRIYRGTIYRLHPFGDRDSDHHNAGAGI